jgi:hypothetical protein
MELIFPTLLTKSSVCAPGEVIVARRAAENVEHGAVNKNTQGRSNNNVNQ